MSDSISILRNFKSAIPQLKALEAGLIELFTNGIELTPRERLLICNIASVFDTYLQKENSQTFSQAI